MNNLNIGKYRLERELEKERQKNHRSNLLNPNTRSKYLQYLEEKEWEERQMDRVRRGLPVEDRYSSGNRYLKRVLNIRK